MDAATIATMALAAMVAVLGWALRQLFARMQARVDLIGSRVGALETESIKREAIRADRDRLLQDRLNREAEAQNASLRELLSQVRVRTRPARDGEPSGAWPIGSPMERED